MNVAQLVVACLENEGVRHVFALPGEETLALGLALEDSAKITQVIVRHEQGAAFMADVAGRLTSYPGVCLATLGPGATNLLTGVADATLDGAPLVALTGQAGLERIHKRSHQYVDVLRMFAPVVKWGARVELPDSAPEVIRTAFRVARLERPGATHVELPEDVAEQEADGRPMPVRRTRYAAARDDAINAAADAINGAGRPILLVGNGVIRSDCRGPGRGRGAARVGGEDAHPRDAHVHGEGRDRLPRPGRAARGRTPTSGRGSRGPPRARRCGPGRVRRLRPRGVGAIDLESEGRQAGRPYR